MMPKIVPIIPIPAPARVRREPRRSAKSYLAALCLFLTAWFFTGCTGSPGGTVNPPTPFSGSISGAISGGGGATVTLSGPANSVTTADASGSYVFNGLANGTYTLTPMKTGLTFNPNSRSVTVNGASVASVNFTATSQPALTFSISGAITPQTGGANAAVALSGAAVASTTSNASGNYTFPNLASGGYVVTPSNPGFAFTPATQSVTISSSNVSNINFTASAVPPTFSISGTIAPAAVGSGSVVSLTGAASASTTADATGTFRFNGLANGSYTVTPAKSGVTYNPTSQAVTINGSNVANVNFTATSSSNVFFFDDFLGNSLSADWTVISRHGEYAQSETECNIPQQVSVANSILTITTDAVTATCGDFNVDGTVRHPASSWPYVTGDIQWTKLNFTYGTVEYRAKFPAQATGTWPAIWLLGANCQQTNIFTADTNYLTCPDIGAAGYVEIDATECDLDNWCQLLYFNFAPAQRTPRCGYAVDTNWHVFSLTWSPTVVSMSVDGKPTGCSFDGGAGSNNVPIPAAPMFLLIQTQTGGAGGTPNNALLPAQFQVDYVKVTQP